MLWPGLLYLCKTSGTTSGAKYIPITQESLSNHIGSVPCPARVHSHIVVERISWMGR